MTARFKLKTRIIKEKITTILLATVSVALIPHSAIAQQYRNISSWIAPISISILRSSSSFTQLTTAESEGYRFDVLGLDRNHWILRVRKDGKFIADVTARRTLPHERIVENLVLAARSSYAQYQQGRRFYIRIPPISSNQLSWTVDRSNLPLYNMLTQLAERDQQLMSLTDQQPLTARYKRRDISGQVIDLGEFDGLHWIIELNDGGYIIPHSTYSINKMTFRPGSLIHTVVQRELANRPTLEYVGDRALNPPMINFYYPGGAMMTLFERAAYVARSDNNYRAFLKPDGSELLSLASLSDGERRIIGTYVIRNYSFVVGSTSEQYLLFAKSPDGLDEIWLEDYFNDPAPANLYSYPHRLQRVGGGEFELRYDNSDYLYLLAGILSDYKKYWIRSANYQIGGALMLRNGGFLRLQDPDGVTELHASGAIRFPDGSLQIPGLRGLPPQTFDRFHPAYPDLNDLVNLNYTVGIDKFTGRDTYDFIAKREDEEIYFLLFIRPNLPPRWDFIDPVQVQQFQQMQLMMMSNILAMQHQTSMNIIGNMAPTPVEWVYR